MIEIEARFPGGKRVDAYSGGELLLRTDQPIDGGGEGTAPGPYEAFLASLATCAGYYVLEFCRARGLSTDGLSLLQRVDVDEATHLPRKISIELALPPGFPEKYRTAIVRAAEGCKVKKTIARMPPIDVVLAPAVTSCSESAP